MLLMSAMASPARSSENPRKTVLLDKDWLFSRCDDSTAEWQAVRIPHDWAIFGPFDRNNDLQTLAVTQNLETAPDVKTGRTGGLPYIGKGVYRRTFDADIGNGRQAILLFDGAMSEARVYVNGKPAIYWPYGYNSFYCNVTSLLNADGKDNTLEVRLENRRQSSRWYPGAGLYRNVYLIETDRVHVPVWGTRITTGIMGNRASVQVETEVTGINANESIILHTGIYGMDGSPLCATTEYDTVSYSKEEGRLVAVQSLEIPEPELWSPDRPYLYKAVTTVEARPKHTLSRGRHVEARKRLCDTYTTVFGVRTIEIRPGSGFWLNGENIKFKGVCLHHDLGPLGAAVNKSAMRHRLSMLKDMGCNAIRTSHNMPSTEFVELCDEMGFMVIVESFDEWDDAKCLNGYHRFFDEWAEKDLVNMIRHFRNSPSVVMWSVGNEVPSQSLPGGDSTAAFLQGICHREDPTRPVTCGMDHIDAILSNGFGDVFDIPGFNYRVHRYEEGYERLPQKMILGSETVSTVSSRGAYHFPVIKGHSIRHPDHQSSSYDVEYCGWSNIPDEDLAMAEDNVWAMGQFVWTGFDYLGEPTPYDTDSWPSHSSVFGIIDLASLPKDRFYLYRSVWNEDSPTLHVLPHWNWEERTGLTVPVFVYTSYPKAELFLNGRSLGTRGKNDSSPMHRFRLMWDSVKYEPGELRVVAYGRDGQPAAEKTIQTASAPYSIELVPARTVISADDRELAYITVRIVDSSGILCPRDSRKVRLTVSGNGSFEAVANGDPTCLEAFREPEMSVFNGMMTLIVRSDGTPGEIKITAAADGIESCTATIKTE